LGNLKKQMEKCDGMKAQHDHQGVYRENEAKKQPYAGTSKRKRETGDKAPSC
jgi:hypothetical protein